MKIKLFIFVTVLFLTIGAERLFAVSPDPTKLVGEAIDYWRDSSSYSEAEMIIHRPDRSRELGFVAWTKGESKALVRFTSPAKDAGSSTLSVDDVTWSYSPKINRIVKIPPSMKAQSWMGSDFSYRDLTKADDIVSQYNHTLLSVAKDGDHTIYIVESIPKESAPVVWGKEILKIRDDKVILEHEFYDQDNKLVKVLKVEKIGVLNGKLYPERMRISKIELPNEWTEVVHTKVRFKDDFSDNLFSLNSLRAQK